MVITLLLFWGSFAFHAMAISWDEQFRMKGCLSGFFLVFARKGAPEEAWLAFIALFSGLNESVH